MALFKVHLLLLDLKLKIGECICEDSSTVIHGWNESASAEDGNVNIFCPATVKFDRIPGAHRATTGLKGKNHISADAECLSGNACVQI